jgi:hypothetical protein
MSRLSNGGAVLTPKRLLAAAAFGMAEAASQIPTAASRAAVAFRIK